MRDGQNSPPSPAEKLRRAGKVLRFGYALTARVGLPSFIAALIFPRSFQLGVFGDLLEVGLVGTFSLLAFQNTVLSRGQARTFWFLLFVGAALWLGGLLIWTTQELWFRHPLPDVPFSDTLLFLKLVPLVAATSLEPQKAHDSRFRPFG